MPRTIGLLGGMSWESSILYEQIINTEIRRRLGGSHSADLVIRSYDFAQVESLQAAGDWDAAGRLLAADARRLEEAGAGIIVLCTNTMHRVAGLIELSISIPFLHLADVTAAAVHSSGLTRVGLLGTMYTMEQPFYRDRLVADGLDVMVPDEPDRSRVHDIIYQELVQGQVRPESKQAFRAVIDRLIGRGAEGVIAGCTEIELLISAADLDEPYFPTTRLHAMAAVDWSLSSDDLDCGR